MTHTIGVLIMAYGGPDSLDDVEPYLLDVRGGRPMRQEMIDEVTERYRLIGGRSPIRERTVAQAEQLERSLNASNGGPAYRCVVGMRHWTPRIETALPEIAAAGISKAVGLVMAPHYSRMSVGAYFEKVTETGSPVEVAPIERWNVLPELLDTLAARVVDGLAKFPDDIRDRVQIVFTAHSLPERILEWNDPYPDELRATVDGIARRLADEGVGNTHEFAYQSAAMTPDPWLGPDAGDVITHLHEQGVPGALIAPVGFTSEHVEILYDIDIQLAQAAKKMGFALQRISMLNDDERTMSGLAGLVRQTARDRGWE